MSTMPHWSEYELGEEIIRRATWKGRGHRKDGMRRYDYREFIAWDGEGTATNEPIELRTHVTVDKTTTPPIIEERTLGFVHKWDKDDYDWPPMETYERQPQPYVLLANSKGDRITNPQGLSTHDCFELLLDSKCRYPDSIFVGFGFNYDVNQMLKDVPEQCLWQLHDENEMRYGSYYVRWLPRKQFTISQRKHGKKRSVTLYDVFSFFGTSFIKVCEEYLGKDDPQLALIQRGKQARAEFEYEEMEEFIIPYNAAELEMLVRVMNIVREDFHNVGLDLSRWHGPGAAANEEFRRRNIPITRDIPEEVNNAARYAYAGGRFEQFFVGRHPDTVYEYDIRSAYPAAAIGMPDLSCGRWEHVDSYEPETFGVWRIEYRSPHGEWSNRPEPLFCRSEPGLISFPHQVQGWYWTPEADLVPDAVREGYVFRPDTDARPFAFIEELYEQRRIYKQQGNPTQRAIKTIINSMYGKLAQTVGGEDGPPRWHQLEYAGWITSTTRAKIYTAIQQDPDAIIATETDAVFSKRPLDLPESPALGDWECTEFKEIMYLQSGFYYAFPKEEEQKKYNADGTERPICKYRGMDRDRDTQQPVGLPYRDVLDHLSKHSGWRDRPTLPLHSYTTRFVGLGLGLRNPQTSVWRSWEKKNHVVSLDQHSWINKRYHLSKLCVSCHHGIPMSDEMHPMEIGGYEGKSFPRPLPWIEDHVDEEAAIEIDWDEWQELNPDFRGWAEYDFLDKWQ